MASSATAQVKSPAKRSLYKGDPGMWSWVFHRISGVAIFFFLFVHVLDTSLMAAGPDAYNPVVETYKTWYVGLLEIGLVALVLFHALNGIRIVLVDFWSQGIKYQRQMLWAVVAIWVVVFGASVVRLVQIMAGHVF